MTRITAYNTFSTKQSRVVATYEIETDDAREAMTQAVYRACMWNKDETRPDMKVNFVKAGELFRGV